MRTNVITKTTQPLGALIGLLSAGVLIGAPVMAQSTTSPQAPAPTYPSTKPAPEADPTMPEAVESQAPGASTTPGTAETPTPGEPIDTSSLTIAELASNATDFTALAAALEAADLTETLASEGPYTVFAPTDEAFAALPAGALEFLLQPENKALLQQVLTYHVADGAILSSDLSTGTVETLGGGLAVQVDSEGVIINDASVIGADIEASNGIIHVVNQVLLPEDLRQTLAEEMGVGKAY